MHPNHSFILIQESFWIAIHIYLVKQFKIESSDIFQILEYFQNVDVYFINQYLTVWGFTIAFPQVPLFKKLLDFPIHLLIPAWGHFVTIKTSQDEFSFGIILFHQETTYFTHKEDFFPAKYRSPNGPHLLPMVQPIRSPENPGTTVVSIGHLTPWPETLDIAPKCGINIYIHIHIYMTFFLLDTIGYTTWVKISPVISGFHNSYFFLFYCSLLVNWFDSYDIHFLLLNAIKPSFFFREHNDHQCQNVISKKVLSESTS